MSEITWSCREFAALSAKDVYAVLKLRAEIFIVEQNCAYLDPDGDDQAAWHVMGTREGQLVAYTRLLPPGIKYESCSIGRVVTSDSIRGEGFGRALMVKSIEYCQQMWPQHAITISAQHYLEDFYISLGFNTESEPYLEDDIPHVRMCLPHSEAN